MLFTMAFSSYLVTVIFLARSHEVEYSWKLKANEKMKSFKTTVAILFFVYGMGTFFYELVAIALSVQDVDAWLPP